MKIAGYSFIETICDAAGLIGMAAALALCSLAFSGQPMAWLWSAAGVSLAGNLLYITHVFARRATGSSALTWRELVLANIVPVAAIAITVLVVGQVAGLFHLPIGPSTNKHVISVSPDQGAAASPPASPSAAD